jgi:hypothetical protein
MVALANPGGGKLGIEATSQVKKQCGDCSGRLRTKKSLFLQNLDYWNLRIAISFWSNLSTFIHLHGHDFFVLGHQASSNFDASTMMDQLNFENPPRRDTATLPAAGWLVLAFEANNPGAWLMHCHIAWHISEGLGVQFLEAKNQIVLPDQTQFTQQCSSWKQYAAHMAWPQIDSGL